MLDSMTSTATPRRVLSDWEREIAALVIETLGLEVNVDALSPDEPLYGEGLGLDSIDMLEIAIVLSQRYKVEIRSDDARNERIFASLGTLADHVARHRGG
jgi:acyl carrier protein